MPTTTYVRTGSSANSGSLVCYSFGWPGNSVAVGAITDDAIVPIPGSFTLWQAVAQIAPSGAPDVFDVLKNGVSIFAGTSPPAYPSIPDSVLTVQTGSVFGASVPPNTFTDLYTTGLGYFIGSLTYNFASVDIGQTLTITAGTGFIAGTYPIVALQIGSNGQPTGIAVLGEVCAVASSTGGSGFESGVSGPQVTVAVGDVLTGVVLSSGGGQSDKLQVYAQ